MLYRCKTTKKLLKLAVIASIFVGFVAPQSAFASVQDFYFSEMHTDYYLSRESDGISKMRVKETLTVQFPKTNQNKGIERAIPLTNQGGVNIVFNDTNVTVTRNGTLEPIWSTERTKNYYLVATGTDDYILGEQVFGFEYVMDRVVTDFGDYQELFWDVNGTDWKQRFDSVSTTVHFDAASAEAFTGKTTCYTGVYGSKERACTVVVTDDGKSVTITATRALQPSENLSFVLGFNAGVFVVPEGQESYLGFTASMISTSLAIVISALSIVEYRRRVHRPKKQHERTIVPEYLPPKEVSVFDAQGVLFGIKKGGNVMTAQIIDLAVRHKIKIIEEESKGLLGKVKKTYFLELLSREGLRSEESELLDILFFQGKSKVEIKAPVAPKTAAALRSFTLRRDIRLETSGYYIEKKERKKLTRLGMYCLASFILLIAQCAVGELVSEQPGRIFGEEVLTIALLAIILEIVQMVCIFGSVANSVVVKLTEKGWDMHYYLKGLEMYIKYAETERLKFLQSVKGAERVNVDDKTKVIKLYEKLLPYAILFGQEKSWASVIQIYTEELNASPDWVSTAGTFSLVNFMSSSGGSFASSMSASYSGGTGSSSSSGSGFSSGGGLSGGGGGGGGGGGR